LRYGGRNVKIPLGRVYASANFEVKSSREQRHRESRTTGGDNVSLLLTASNVSLGQGTRIGNSGL